MTRGVVAFALASGVACGVCARPASAQTPSPDQRHRVEVSAGGAWLAGGEMGSRDAELRANRVPAGAFRLFATETRSASSPGFDGRVAWWLTRSIALEGGLVFSRPALRTRLSADAESAPALTVEESVDQYFVEGGVVWLIERFRFRDRTVPFVSGGAGYLRQLHEGRTLIETGQVYHVGAGLRHWLRQGNTGWIRAMGVRIDGRAYVLVNGLQLEDRPRTRPAFSGSLFLTF